MPNLKLHKLALLDLLIAIDEEIIDWRNYPKLYRAINSADIILDLWAGMDLNRIKEELVK